jgi:hypothetical protein
MGTKIFYLWLATIGALFLGMLITAHGEQIQLRDVSVQLCYAPAINGYSVSFAKSCNLETPQVAPKVKPGAKI